MNCFNATGNLGRDAQVRQAGQSTVCSFALGISSGWGDNKQTVWLDCSIWGKQAQGQLPQYLTKGAKVAVTGELGQREYQAQDGTMKTVLTLRVNGIDLIGGNQGQQPAPRPAPVQQPQQQPKQDFDFDDDIDLEIPF
jgi:single-strand DNA-binding protein